MRTDLIHTTVGNHKVRFRITGPGLVVDVHRNFDELGVLRVIKDQVGQLEFEQKMNLIDLFV
jgi:hypothetical protein